MKDNPVLGKFNIDAQPLIDVRGEELKAAYDRIDALMHALNACREWFHNRADVCGTTPSSEMEMLKGIDGVLLEPFPSCAPGV